ncbi:MAG: hypothetical protein GF388_09995 [Candidatus Aegiribacteria sp.]|nr:hypothetical protein [Candidatus Aegiribacteria sp.]MBD3295364.1 hypothetical protein [Candidatus Fermentibacteria bacterium]
MAAETFLAFERRRLIFGETAMRLLFATTLSFLILTASCGEGEGEVTHSTDSTARVTRTVELPGALVAPSGDTVQVPAETTVLLYYWLPLDLYPSMEIDLEYLASLDSAYMVLPVQPDPESRNHAQRTVNNLGVVLPVYLADSSVMSMMSCEILPVCLAITPGGEILTEAGFESPSRLAEKISSR